VVHSTYGELFVVIATAAATLIGLLFVAMSVDKGRSQEHAPIIREFRAAASLLAFSNSFTVSLFGLVPGNNIGYPALVIGLTGLIFVAAGLRTTLTLPPTQQRRRPQFFLMAGLVGVFGFQVFSGVRLIANPDRSGALVGLGDVLIVSLLIGIARAWELVGSWDTGLASSISVLLGLRKAPEPQGPGSDPAEGDGAH
jgi:hypothetical protein